MLALVHGLKTPSNAHFIVQFDGAFLPLPKLDILKQIHVVILALRQFYAGGEAQRGILPGDDRRRFTPCGVIVQTENKLPDMRMGFKIFRQRRVRCSRQ